MNRQFVESQAKVLQGEVDVLKRQVHSIEETLAKADAADALRRQKIIADGHGRMEEILKRLGEPGSSEKIRAQRDAELRASELLLQSELNAVSSSSKIRAAGIEEAFKTRGEEYAKAAARLSAFQDNVTMPLEVRLVSVSVESSVFLSTKKAVALGCVLGLILGCAAAILADILPQAMKNQNSGA